MATIPIEHETTLLAQINHGLAPAEQTRFAALVAKRQEETITSDELAELSLLTDQIERDDAVRLAALLELAPARRTSLTDLMTSLGLSAPDND